MRMKGPAVAGPFIGLWAIDFLTFTHVTCLHKELRKALWGVYVNPTDRTGLYLRIMRSSHGSILFALFDNTQYRILNHMRDTVMLQNLFGPGLS